jgi:hypothetical protein
MSPPKDLERLARERVERLLRGRLTRGVISTTRPARFFAAEPGPPQELPGGWQVRVKTWRHWSDARVHLDADDGSVLYRSIERLSDPPCEDTELSQSEAEEIVRRELPVPATARVRSFWHETFAEQRHVARIEWEHWHKDVRVDGDYLFALIHPQTKRIVAYGMKWRPVR